jgi:hypothetical protein
LLPKLKLLIYFINGIKENRNMVTPSCPNDKRLNVKAGKMFKKIFDFILQL